MLLVEEFDNGVKLPWAVACGVRAAAGVVLSEAAGSVRREPYVEMRRPAGVPQNVYESFGSFFHGGDRRQTECP